MKSLENQLEEQQRYSNIGDKKTTGQIFLKVLDLLFVPTSFIRQYIKIKKENEQPREPDPYWELMKMCDPFGSLRLIKKATIYSLIFFGEITRIGLYIGNISRIFSNSQQ